MSAPLKYPSLALISLSIAIASLSGCFCGCPNDYHEDISSNVKDTMTFKSANSGEEIMLISKRLECSMVKVDDIGCNCYPHHLCSRLYQINNSTSHPLNCSETYYGDSQESYRDVYFHHGSFHLNYRVPRDTVFYQPYNDTTVAYYPMRNTYVGDENNPIDSVYYSNFGIFKVVYKDGTIWWRIPNP
ncbi:MAG: hypothetical protein RLZZ262_1253 [Bacteroidota bacterium]|jgi:hypothetical protein